MCHSQVSPCLLKGGGYVSQVVPEASAELHCGKAVIATVPCLTCTSVSPLFPLLLWHQSLACEQDWWAISSGHWQGAVIHQMSSVSRGWSYLSPGGAHSWLMGGCCRYRLPQSKTQQLRGAETQRRMGSHNCWVNLLGSDAADRFLTKNLVQFPVLRPMCRFRGCS